MAELTYLEALKSAMREELIRDDSVYLLGEDIAAYGGCYGVTAGLFEEFGAERVINTPISEIAIVGSAVGAAMMGFRPVVEIMYADFLYVCADQIINQAPRMRYILGGDTKVPLVVRTAFGGGGRYSFNHSQSPEASFLNAPGLAIMMPSTPADAKGMLKAAIRSNNPVLFSSRNICIKPSKARCRTAIISCRSARVISSAPARMSRSLRRAGCCSAPSRRRSCSRRKASTPRCLTPGR